MFSKKPTHLHSLLFRYMLQIPFLWFHLYVPFALLCFHIYTQCLMRVGFTGIRYQNIVLGSGCFSGTKLVKGRGDVDLLRKSREAAPAQRGMLWSKHHPSGQHLAGEGPGGGQALYEPWLHAHTGLALFPIHVLSCAFTGNQHLTYPLMWGCFVSKVYSNTEQLPMTMICMWSWFSEELVRRGMQIKSPCSPLLQGTFKKASQCSLRSL